MKKTLPYLYLILFFITTSFFGQQIPSYYNGLDFSKTGNELFLELSGRIESTHTGIPYTSSTTDVWDACKLADEDPDISTNVLLIYGFDDADGDVTTDRSRNKDLQDTGGTTGTWNREHVFAKSLANPNLGTDEPGPGTDVHNLRPADTQRNSTRSNRKFTDGTGEASYIAANGGWYPGDEWKGDVARIVMYMYTRYHGNGTQISQTNCLPTNVGVGAVLEVDENMVDLFLKWNVEDPVSSFEANRNELLAGIQGNRNPYIDNPYLATLIWGGLAAEDKWNMNSSSDTEAPSTPENLVASNITDTTVEISWDASTDNVEVYDYLIYVNEVYTQTETTTSTILTNLIAATTYQITIKARDISSNYSNMSAVLEFTTAVGPKVLFEEDFSDCGNLNFVTYSEASNKNWECQNLYGENNSGSMGMNGNQQDVLSKDWLITVSPVDFDNSTGEMLSFYTDAAYGDTPLELVFSSDYDGSGNPSNYTWNEIPNVSIPIHSTGTGTEEVYSFTNIDISEISGSVYIAFKYYSTAEPTRWTVDSFKIIADNEDNDDIDGDGVLNVDDLCPNTPLGEVVDVNGCSNGQLDDDNDGIKNSTDLCPNTPAGESVNVNGCSESQLDDDNDGVMNNIDTCPNTPVGEEVDISGCSNGQLDDDNDGVQNSADLCPNTPRGKSVDVNGCSESQLDDDKDGVMNNIDTCPNTPLGEDVNVNGCSNSQLDDDNDGVMNDMDQCLNTSLGAPINEVGCFALPPTNFTIEVTGETCAGKENGSIEIAAQEAYNYSVTEGGTVYNFTNTTNAFIEGLAPDTYEFCISVEGETYQQCYTVTVDAGTSAKASAKVVSNKAFVAMEQGTAPYQVLVNGKTVLHTYAPSFEVAVTPGDLLEVKTDIACEGVFSKQIELFSTITAYPNPTNGWATIVLPTTEKEVLVELYSIQGQLISSKNYPVMYGKIQVNLENKPIGLYLAKVYLDETLILKIIRE